MGVLLMLMTIGGLIAAAFMLVVSIFAKMPWLRKFTLGAVTLWIVFYSTLLIGFSLFSVDKILAANEPKAFCGFYLDCHMHATVTNVRKAKAIGPITAGGIFYIVDVKVFSDARNPDIVLHLITPNAEIIDRSGFRYQRSIAAERHLTTADAELGSEIRAAQPIEKEIVFDVPEGAADLRLLITDGYGIDRYIEGFLIDDEDSFLHKRTYFRLLEQNETAGVNYQ